MKTDRIKALLSKCKYPLLILLVGIVLIALPSGSNKDDRSEVWLDEEERLSAILEECSGVGSVKTLLSENGAVIVCSGADDPNTRLNVINAVRAYTGLGWDEIQVFKTRQK